MKITNGMDYRTIEKGLRLVADKFDTYTQGRTSPFAKLKSTNFMTPDVVIVRRLTNGIWYELSYGTGFSSNYIFGVTLMDDAGTYLFDMNECVHEFSEVEEVLEKAMKLTLTV